MFTGEIILYTTEDIQTSIQLRAEEGTVWFMSDFRGKIFFGL
jgi:hypothetical protein